MPKLVDLSVHRVHLPLIRPYRLSYRTFHAFEPIIVVACDDSGGEGFGEGHISPGSSEETREQGWAVCCEQAAHIAGMEVEAAMAHLQSVRQDSKVAVSAMICAIDMLQGNALLNVEEAVRLPLLAPINALEASAIATEVEDLLTQGFMTFKVKVGLDVETDLARTRAIQRSVAGRASLRLDANRAFSEEEAKRFVGNLDPDGIELLEQPCAADDWEANAAVAESSPVPLMLDEPINAIGDIERAADIDGVDYCKLKLKRAGSVGDLHRALLRVRELGMEPVLGDGLGSEPTGWMEACVARSTIRNAGEFNGFLKPEAHLFEQPLVVEEGALVLPAGFRPVLDLEVLEKHSVERQHFG